VTRARRWGAALAGIAACLAAAGFTIATAASTSPPEAAYWWQPEPVTGLIPVPGVPPNGLYVASAPSGPQAESAVRFNVADPTGEVRLVLHVSKQEQVKRPGILGYPATSHWSTGGPQPWSARPSYRSTAHPARGIFNAALTIMIITFPAAEAAKGIVLVPAGAKSGGQSPTFTISFAPPSSNDVLVAGEPSPSAGPSSNNPSSSSSSSSHRPSPTNSQTRSGGPKSHRPTPQTLPAKGSVPPTGTAGSTPATSTPTGTASRASRSALTDPDGTTKDIIIIVGVIVAALLILTGWRAARRG
jgi:hypothetical protein